MRCPPGGVAPAIYQIDVAYLVGAQVALAKSNRGSVGDACLTAAKSGADHELYHAYSTMRSYPSGFRLPER